MRAVGRRKDPSTELPSQPGLWGQGCFWRPPDESSAPQLPVGPGNHGVQRALPEGDTGLSLHLCCFVPTVLEDTRKDASPMVSSLATQTVLILKQERLKSRFSLQWLNLQLTRAWLRWHSAPSEDSAEAQTKQQPKPWDTLQAGLSPCPHT